jgi:hypothetical protein
MIPICFITFQFVFSSIGRKISFSVRTVSYSLLNLLDLFKMGNEGRTNILPINCLIFPKKSKGKNNEFYFLTKNLNKGDYRTSEQKKYFQANEKFASAVKSGE